MLYFGSSYVILNIESNSRGVYMRCIFLIYLLLRIAGVFDENKGRSTKVDNLDQDDTQSVVRGS